MVGSCSYDAYGVMLGGNPTVTSPAATNYLYAGEATGEIIGIFDADHVLNPDLVRHVN